MKKGNAILIVVAFVATLISVLTPATTAFAEEDKGWYESAKDLYHNAKDAKELAEKGAGWYDGITATLTDWRLLVGTHSPEGAMAFAFLFLGLVLAAALMKKTSVKTFILSLVAARVAVLVAELTGNQAWLSYAYLIPPLAVLATWKWWHALYQVGVSDSVNYLLERGVDTTTETDEDEESDEGSEDEAETPTPATTTVTCPHCHQAVEKGARCTKCGKDLLQPRKKTPKKDKWGLGF